MTFATTNNTQTHHEQILDVPKSFHAPNLSPYGMYLQAHPVVKAVMIVLLIASVITWAIFFVKYVQLLRAKHAARLLLADLIHHKTLKDALSYKDKASCTQLLQACRLEIELSSNMQEQIEKRVQIRMQRVQGALVADISSGTGILASIGAIAPFVGLFGTVWGIMNAFIGIAKSQTTNLAVVAPGIAEALLATAMGLLAAIPAVLIYNYFVRKIASYKIYLGDINASILILLSRSAREKQ